MVSEKIVIEILEDPKATSGSGLNCQGPDSFGRCPQERQDGTVFCRDHYLWVHAKDEEEGAAATERWIWSVGGHAKACPLDHLR